MPDTTQTMTDAKLCAECGGECCKHFPGILWPDQIELTTVGVMESIAAGYVIDWWEGDIEDDGDLDQVYFIRPFVEGDRGPVHASWGGVCGFLGDGGCTLARDQRPTLCLLLQPHPVHHGSCVQPDGYGKTDCVRAWRPHQKLLCAIVHELRCSMPNCHDCGTCVDVCWSRDVEAWVCIDCREQRIKRTIEDNRAESEAETAENERYRRMDRGRAD